MAREVFYWIFCIVLLGVVMSEGRTLVTDAWPGHNGVVWPIYIVLYIAALAALIIRRQQHNGEVPYSVARAGGFAIVVLVVPVLIMAGLATVLTALHIWS